MNIIVLEAENVSALHAFSGKLKKKKKRTTSATIKRTPFRE